MLVRCEHRRIKAGEQSQQLWTGTPALTSYIQKMIKSFATSSAQLLGKLWADVGATSVRLHREEMHFSLESWWDNGSLSSSSEGWCHEADGTLLSQTAEADLVEGGLILHARASAMKFSASPLKTSLTDPRLRLKLKCAEQQTQTVDEHKRGQKWFKKKTPLTNTHTCMHTHEHPCTAIRPGTVYSHLGLNRVISGIWSHQLSVGRGAERRSPRLSLTTLLLRPHAVSACVCSRCRLADCCDSSDSVTHQIEEHWRDVPTLFLQWGWTGEEWALPSGGVSGGWDKCSWLPLNNLS